MKELEQLYKDKTEITAQQQQEKKQVLVGSVNPKPNHTLYEYNVKNNTITKAEFEQTDVDFFELLKGGLSLNKKVLIKENCVYITALNVNNAIKKTEKLLNKKINNVEEIKGGVKSESHDYEVIGNIHENPELLGGEK